MEEICILPSNKEEIDLNNIQCIRIEKSKRKKPKRRFKRLLILSLILAVSLSVAFNFNEIKEYASTIFTLSSDSYTSQSSSIIEDTEQTDANEALFSFVTTYAVNHKIINETDLQINFEDTVAFPKRGEISEIYGENAPIVLIVNFSPTEAYATQDGYSSSEEFYSDTYNVKAIGEEICKRLNGLSVPALHLCNDTSTSLFESKAEYKKAIEAALLENPSIAYVIDISRSLTLNQDGSVTKELTSINGESYPTLELLCGTNGTELTESRLKSILFASYITKDMNESGTTLVSRQTVSKYTLMQDFDTICFRADIGSFATPYSEALKTALLFAEHLAKIINE